ncbi:MAG: hypothetical protein PGN16_03710 [Sphingomonas phyllosphaerae]|uniref:hypothetical protein n=1 Tax=Sphingomonas phyllosphaerae TaxID=257003 RepID=UPI002FFC3656
MLWMLLAASAPIYLSCEVPSGPNPNPVEMTLDETQGRATIYVVSTGVAYKAPAAFTSEKVIVREEQSVWTIDRTTLAAERSYNFGRQPNFDTGKCVVKPAPANRAF